MYLLQGLIVRLSGRISTGNELIRISPLAWAFFWRGR
jgi:hypothetical protein